MLRITALDQRFHVGGPSQQHLHRTPQQRLDVFLGAALITADHHCTSAAPVFQRHRRQVQRIDPQQQPQHLFGWLEVAQVHGHRPVPGLLREGIS